MLFKKYAGFALAVAAILLLPGCGDKSGTSETDGTEEDTVTGNQDAGNRDTVTENQDTVTGNQDAGNPDTAGSLPGLNELDDDWNELLTGGNTVCARGEAFSFFVHPGTVDKVVVDFMGGGACWDARTCAVPDETIYFIDSVEPIRQAVEGGALIGLGKLDGIYNRTREDNPFKDWHHIIIPYCTGDLHWGDAGEDYGSVQIEHRGAVNARAVLDWMYDNFAAPEQIFVTGCSAGSYGSAIWSAYIMQHYPATQVIQFGDSGVGVITPAFFQDGFGAWNAEQAYPSWIPALDPATQDILYPDLYIGIANYYPTNFMSEYNYTFDPAQFFYFQEMGGGDMQAFSSQIQDSFDTIEANTNNFAVFMPSGEGHCILPRSNFYTAGVDGTMFVDWLGELLSTGSVASLRCAASSPFGLVAGVNDFEVTDECGFATGVSALTNSKSTNGVTLNRKNPLNGAQDLLIDFELRNEYDDPEQGAWSQWNLISVAMAAESTDLRGTGIAGVRFLARADQSRQMRVDFESGECHRFNEGICFGWVVQVTQEPQIFDLRLDEAALPSWTDNDGEDLEATLRSAIALSFRPDGVGLDAEGLYEAGTSDRGWVQVDDIELFE